MNQDDPYCIFLRVAEECRNELLLDTLENNSVELDAALLSNVNSEIFRVEIELYELMWIEKHWEKLIQEIENRNLSISDRKKAVTLFSKWYLQFISEWEYTEFDSLAFKERKKILNAIISVNNEWDKSLKRMKVSFERSKKNLKLKLKELERGI